MKRFLFQPLNDNFFRAILEATVWFIIYISIGIFFFPEDALFISHNILVAVAFLSVITLFYGVHISLYIWVMFGVFLIFFYDIFPLTLYLKLLVLILMWGAFYVYWTYHLKLERNEKTVLSYQVKELANAFYALKTSHDQLELNHILRPVSLRRTLMEIVKIFDKDSSSEAYERFLVLLSKTFNVSRLVIAVSDEENQLHTVSKAQNSTSLDIEDPLVKNAIDSHHPVYISQKPEKSRYIAVVPAVRNGQVVGIVAIEEMPFMAFNTDNLIFIAFIFRYFLDTLHYMKVLKEFTLFQGFDENFRFELVRAESMYKEFHIDSTMVIFKTKHELTAYKLRQMLQESRRGLDAITWRQIGETYIVIVLAPFSILSSLDALRDRVLSCIDKKERKGIEVFSFPVSSISLAWEYIQVETDSNDE